MKTRYLPQFWTKVSVDNESGDKIEGLIAGYHCESGKDECVLQLPDGTRKNFPISSIKLISHDFGSIDDVLLHIISSGKSRHCENCYVAVLYAIDLIAEDFNAHSFLSRLELIKKGVINFLSGDFSQAAFALLPQVEGIIIQTLHEEGLLKATDSFPMWTREHPDLSFHNKHCRNISNALEGADIAGDKSKLRGILSLRAIDKRVISSARNKLLHGALLNISEHEAASLIFLLHALYHVIQLGSRFKK